MILRNDKQARWPQARRAPLPELAEFLAPLRVHFTQGPSAETLRQYLTGLLSEHPNKNCDTLAEVVPETTEQQFNHLLTDMVWDETALNRQRIARMQTLPSEGDGVLIFDDTGFEKRGRHSCVTCDADYGDNPNFLNGLEQRAERHVVAVRADFSVTLGREPQSPVQR